VWDPHALLTLVLVGARGAAVGAHRDELIIVTFGVILGRDHHVISDTVLPRPPVRLDAEQNRINPPSTVA
jgi:hypothetical protein